MALWQNTLSSLDLLIVQPTVKLCTIPVKLEENVEVEAILDNGSQVISIHQDVWKRLRSPIHTNQAITMESANGSHDRMMGLLLNLWVVINKCDFYLQVQVIESTLFRMLLRCSFFTLAQASTQHFFPGNFYITLLDPNSAKLVILPICPCICCVLGFQWSMIPLPAEKTNLVIYISKALLQFLPHLQYLSRSYLTSYYLQYCSPLSLSSLLYFPKIQDFSLLSQTVSGFSFITCI